MLENVTIAGVGVGGMREEQIKNLQYPFLPKAVTMSERANSIFSSPALPWRDGVWPLERGAVPKQYLTSVFLRCFCKKCDFVLNLVLVNQTLTTREIAVFRIT